MQTLVELDSKLYEAAATIAAKQKSTVTQVINKLVRNSLEEQSQDIDPGSDPAPRTLFGFPSIPCDHPVTAEEVDRLLDESIS